MKESHSLGGTTGQLAGLPRSMDQKIRDFVHQRVEAVKGGESKVDEGSVGGDEEYRLGVYQGAPIAKPFEVIRELYERCGQLRGPAEESTLEWRLSHG